MAGGSVRAALCGAEGNYGQRIASCGVNTNVIHQDRLQQQQHNGSSSREEGGQGREMLAIKIPQHV